MLIQINRGFLGHPKRTVFARHGDTSEPSRASLPEPGCVSKADSGESSREVEFVPFAEVWTDDGPRVVMAFASSLP